MPLAKKAITVSGCSSGPLAQGDSTLGCECRQDYPSPSAPNISDRRTSAKKRVCVLYLGRFLLPPLRVGRRERVPSLRAADSESAWASALLCRCLSRSVQTSLPALKYVATWQRACRGPASPCTTRGCVAGPRCQPWQRGPPVAQPPPAARWDERGVRLFLGELSSFPRSAWEQGIQSRSPPR
jgi:hypothetical protein